jgi:hypothetical protein
MSDALTGPHAVAAALLCVAGLAKLSSPAAAARALSDAGLTVNQLAIRLFAAAELALGAWSAVAPRPVSSALLALVYAGFAATTLVLWRRSEPGGCFGEDRTPASPLQALLSGSFAALCAASIGASPHGLRWALGRPPGSAAVLVLGTAAAVYGAVLAYSELPRAWVSWSPS